MTTYRVGNHQPQNLYRGDQYIGVMFNPIDAAAVVRHLNMGLGECTCNSYEPCHGECCGVGMCSCSATPEEIAKAGEGLGFKVQCPTWGCRTERGHEGDCNPEVTP
jgi:hypothetical protein